MRRHVTRLAHLQAVV